MNIKFWIIGILLGCAFFAYRQNEKIEEMSKTISDQSNQITKLRADLDIALSMFMNIQDEKARANMKNLDSVDWYSNEENKVWHELKPVPAQ
jgi:outer membrane murein-binding lipoprotein Lpp